MRLSTCLIIAIILTISCTSFAAMNMSELTIAVNGLPFTTNEEKLKKTLLQWGLEDAQASFDAGLSTQAETTMADVENLLSAPANDVGMWQQGNSSVFPTIPEYSTNPYIPSIIAKAADYRDDNETFVKGPSGFVVTDSRGWHFPWIAGRAYTLSWAFGYKDSTYKADFTLLEQLFRDLDHIYEYQNSTPAYDRTFGDFAVLNNANDAYLMLRSAFPNLMLPSKKTMWEQAVKDSADVMVTKYGTRWAAEIAGPDLDTYYTIPNMDVNWMRAMQLAKTILLDSSYDSYIANILTLMEKGLYEDGAFTYISEQNECFGYHSSSIQGLLRYYQLTGDTRASDMIIGSKDYYPISIEPDGVAEYISAPSWKQFWNMSNGAAEAEIVAAFTGCPKNKRIATDFGYGNSLLAASVYDSSITPAASYDDNYLIYDRNVEGPRARYGDYSYVATSRDYGLPSRGKENFTGCMIMDPALSSWPLDSAFIVGTSQVQVAFSGDQNDTNYRYRTYEEDNAVTVGPDFSTLTTKYRIGQTKQYTSWPGNWMGIQQWIMTPTRMIGMCAIEPVGDQTAYSLQGRMKMMSGRAYWGTKKSIDDLGDGLFGYGMMRVQIHDNNYSSVSTAYSNVNGDTADKSAEIYLRDGTSSMSETYTDGTHYYYVAEVYSESSDPALLVERVATANGLYGITINDDGWRLQVVHNPTDAAITYTSGPNWSSSTMLYNSGTRAPISGTPATVVNQVVTATIPAQSHIVLESNCPVNSFDITGDCIVNVADIAELAKAWLNCTHPMNPNCSPAN